MSRRSSRSPVRQSPKALMIFGLRRRIRPYPTIAGSLLKGVRGETFLQKSFPRQIPSSSLLLFFSSSLLLFFSSSFPFFPLPPSLSQAGVEGIAYCFTEQVISHDGYENGQAREDRQPPRDFYVVFPFSQHVAPGGVGRLHSYSKE